MHSARSSDRQDYSEVYTVHNATRLSLDGNNRTAMPPPGKNLSEEAKAQQTVHPSTEGAIAHGQSKKGRTPAAIVPTRNATAEHEMHAGMLEG